MGSGCTVHLRAWLQPTFSFRVYVWWSRSAFGSGAPIALTQGILGFIRKNTLSVSLGVRMTQSIPSGQAVLGVRVLWSVSVRVTSRLSL